MEFPLLCSYRRGPRSSLLDRQSTWAARCPRARPAGASPTRLSRCCQPRLIASVNSSRARLARRIGTPTSLPSPTASETSLCSSRSAKSAGSYWPARNLPSRSKVRARPVAPWRTASHISNGSTPGLDAHGEDLGQARRSITALVQLCTSLAIVPAPIGPIYAAWSPIAPSTGLWRLNCCSSPPTQIAILPRRRTARTAAHRGIEHVEVLLGEGGVDLAHYRDRVGRHVEKRACRASCPRSVRWGRAPPPRHRPAPAAR